MPKALFMKNGVKIKAKDFKIEIIGGKHIAIFKKSEGWFSIFPFGEDEKISFNPALAIPDTTDEYIGFFDKDSHAQISKQEVAKGELVYDRSRIKTEIADQASAEREVRRAFQSKKTFWEQNMLPALMFLGLIMLVGAIFYFGNEVGHMKLIQVSCTGGSGSSSTGSSTGSGNPTGIIGKIDGVPIGIP